MIATAGPNDHQSNACQKSSAAPAAAVQPPTEMPVAITHLKKATIIPRSTTSTKQTLSSIPPHPSAEMAMQKCSLSPAAASSFAWLAYPSKASAAVAATAAAVDETCLGCCLICICCCSATAYNWPVALRPRMVPTPTMWPTAPQVSTSTMVKPAEVINTHSIISLRSRRLSSQYRSFSTH